MIWTMLEEYPVLEEYTFRSGALLIQLDIRRPEQSRGYDLNESFPDPMDVSPSHIEEIFSQFPEIML